MDQSKLGRIIQRKNERLEEDALSKAEDLIAGIVSEQAKIKASTDRIAEYRKQLADLEVEQLDQSAVLGGE